VCILTKIFGAVLTVLAVLGIWGVTRLDGDRHLQVISGRTTICFYPSILESNGLGLKVSSSAEGDSTTGEPSVGFAIAHSDLRYALSDGRLKRYEGGTVSHKGGFTLTSGRNKLVADQFLISSNSTVTDALQMTIDADGKEAISPFELSNARPIFTPKGSQLVVSAIDITISAQGAQRLGRPELAGRLIGMMSVFGTSEPTDGGGEVVLPPPPPHTESAAIDVALSAMSTLTSLGRVGTYPNGRNGLSLSTTSCNVGTNNIPWFAPMQVQHPSIAMNLYRVVNGKFEQIGWSWMKHGFLSTNSNGCGTCQNPGTGTLLGVNCSDTYGTGNNGDRNYLGGRDEVNAFTGVWTCTNSYFSNYQNDCVRRNNGSGLDSVAHRLEVFDQDLVTPGAQYYYEAYYVNANEVNKYNQIGSRQASITWNGSSWTINDINGGMVQGPAINRWGQLRTIATPNTEGDVIVAVQTTDIGGGMWRYDYVLYNHDSDRQVREFSVPMPSGKTVQNILFKDIDKDGTNQWSGAYDGTKVVWSTGAFGVGTPNPLKFASAFNFSFESDVPPVDGSASLGLFKPGNLMALKAASKTPVVLEPIVNMTVVNGAIRSGNQASLDHSDNDRLVMSSTAEGARTGTGVVASVTAPADPLTRFVVGVESNNQLLPVVGAMQKISLWNWTTNMWEEVDSRLTTQADSIALVSITSNLSRFINSNTREIQAKIVQVSNTNGSAYRSLLGYDQIGFQFN
jgi:hypothetical protein